MVSPGVTFCDICKTPVSTEDVYQFELKNVKRLYCVERCANQLIYDFCETGILNFEIADNGCIVLTP